jgi:hypothetical protein
MLSLCNTKLKKKALTSRTMSHAGVPCIIPSPPLEERHNEKHFWAFKNEFNNLDKEIQCIDNWNDESLCGVIINHIRKEVIKS